MIIYKASHIPSGKVYVGCTVNSLSQRIKQHCRSSMVGKSLLSKAIAADGLDAFSWSVLWTGDSQERMWDMESHFIKSLNSIAPNGFNKLPSGPVIDFKILAGIKKSKPNWALGLTKETDPRLISRGIGRKGVECSPIHKQRLSDAKKGIPCPWTAARNRRSAGEASPTAKRYVLTFPDGRESFVVGIGQFCRENNLNHAALGAVALGHRNHHKGYKLRFA